MTPTSLASPTPRNHRWPPILAAALVVGLLSPTPPRSAAASPADACTLTQITPGTVDNDPYVALGPNAVSGDGRFVTFGSYEDLTGGNPGRDYRVFVYDATSASFDQLDGDAIPVGTPSISEDGTHVTFTGAVGQDFKPEVLIHDQTTATTSQLIDTPFGSQPVALSADGTQVLYLEQLWDIPDPLGPWAIKLRDTQAGTTAEIVANAGGAPSDPVNPPHLSPDGMMATFVQEVPLQRNELFLYDRTDATVVQVPGGGTSGGRFTSDGTHLVYTSDQAILGPNPRGRLRHYSYDIASGAIARLGAVPRAATYQWSPDGSHVAFASAGDHTGENPDLTDELFSRDAAGATTQLTDTSPNGGGSRFGLAASADGSNIAFGSNADLTGDNPFNGEQLFIATTCDPAPRPDARIATTNDGPYAGNDLYSSAPLIDQRRSATIAPGGTRNFFVRVQNDRTAPDTFTVSGADAGAAGYDVTYRRAGVDITPGVEDGTYSTGPLDPGAFTTIKIAIHAQAGAGRGHRVDVVARSDTNVVARDTVRAKVTRRS